jgi:hypothetical protein
LTFNELLVVISQKTELFITTAVRTSSPSIETFAWVTVDPFIFVSTPNRMQHYKTDWKNWHIHAWWEVERSVSVTHDV